MHTSPILLALALGLSIPSAPTAQFLLRDIGPPTGNAPGSAPRKIVDLNGVAIFVANSAFGIELWRSDGTTIGTSMLRDIQPGSDSSTPEDLIAIGNFVYFTATLDGIGRELWRTDGTPAGTILLRDIRAGASSSSLGDFFEYQGSLWFRATAASSGSELWTSDGSTNGTRLAVDINPGTVSYTHLTLPTIYSV